MTMTNSEHDQMLKCRAWILVALTAEIGKRHPNEGLEWIHKERRAVETAANLWASSHDLPQVAIADIERVERVAVGHIDYASKFALYVAELVYGVSW